MKFLELSVPLAVCTVLAAVSCSRVKDTPVVRTVTYLRDVKPVLDARCAGCHVDGGLAFSLTSYEATMAKRSAVVDAVSAKRMPVWLAATGHHDYRDDPSLSPAQIQAVQDWKDGGFARGDETTQAPAAGALLRDLDSDLSVPVHAAGTSYLPAQDKSDDYRCFLVPWPYDQTKYMVGMQAVPGNKAIVHHLVVHHARAELVPLLQEMDHEDGRPGYQCFGGALPDRLSDPDVYAKMDAKYPHVLDRQLRNSAWVGHYAPGMRGNLLPEGTGLPIPGGGALVIQVHYYTRNAPNTADGAGEVRFKLADHVQTPGFILPFSNGEWLDAHKNRSLVVPPGQEATATYEQSLDQVAKIGAMILGSDQPVERLTIHSANLHMHSFGKSAVTYLTDKAGGKDVLLEIPAWNLAYQRDYTLIQPKVIEAAALADQSLHVSCTYANKTDHEVFGGFSSDEEMCFNFTFMTLDFKKP